jgi:osmotically inducible lipoprotein OsmB
MRKVAIVLVAGVALSGCANWPTNNPAVNGAIVGGTAGAVIGGVGSGNIGGAAVGGAIGAATGAVVGAATGGL